MKIRKNKNLVCILIMYVFSSHKGAQWCYVQDNIGYGYSTCNDLRKSAKFDGEAWSFHACTTPALTDYKCQYCQGRRCSPNIRRTAQSTYDVGKVRPTTSSSRTNSNGARKDVRPRKPIIKEEDPFAEGVFFNSSKGAAQNNNIFF